MPKRQSSGFVLGASLAIPTVNMALTPSICTKKEQKAMFRFFMDGECEWLKEYGEEGYLRVFLYCSITPVLILLPTPKKIQELKS